MIRKLRDVHRRIISILSGIILILFTLAIFYRHSETFLYTPSFNIDSNAYHIIGNTQINLNENTSVELYLFKSNDNDEYYIEIQANHFTYADMLLYWSKNKINESNNHTLQSDMIYIGSLYARKNQRYKIPASNSQDGTIIFYENAKKHIIYHIPLSSLTKP